MDNEFKKLVMESLAEIIKGIDKIGDKLTNLEITLKEDINYLETHNATKHIDLKKDLDKINRKLYSVEEFISDKIVCEINNVDTNIINRQGELIEHLDILFDKIYNQVLKPLLLKDKIIDLSDEVKFKDGLDD